MRLLAPLLLVMLLVPAASGEVPRSESQAYTAPGVDPTADCPQLLANQCRNLNSDTCTVPEAVPGGVCFPFEGGETTVTVQINDATGDVLSGSYSFRTSGGTRLGFGDFCRGATLAIPYPAVAIEVYVGTDPASGSCPGVATTGTIVANFA